MTTTPAPKLNATTASTTATSTTTTGRKRGRRRQQTILDQPNGLDRVFIWDIDGSLVRGDTIADSMSYEQLEPSVLASVQTKIGLLAKKLKEITINFCDENLFLNELESSDQMHIDDVPSEQTSNSNSTTTTTTTTATASATATATPTTPTTNNNNNNNSTNNNNNNNHDNNNSNYKSSNNNNQIDNNNNNNHGSNNNHQAPNNGHSCANPDSRDYVSIQQARETQLPEVVLDDDHQGVDLYNEHQSSQQQQQQQQLMNLPVYTQPPYNHHHHHQQQQQLESEFHQDHSMHQLDHSQLHQMQQQQQNYPSNGHNANESLHFQQAVGPFSTPDVGGASLEQQGSEYYVNTPSIGQQATSPAALQQLDASYLFSDSTQSQQQQQQQQMYQHHYQQQALHQQPMSHYDQHHHDNQQQHRLHLNHNHYHHYQLTPVEPLVDYVYQQQQLINGVGHAPEVETPGSYHQLTASAPEQQLLSNPTPAAELSVDAAAVAIANYNPDLWVENSSQHLSHNHIQSQQHSSHQFHQMMSVQTDQTNLYQHHNHQHHQHHQQHHQHHQHHHHHQQQQQQQQQQQHHQHQLHHLPYEHTNHHYHQPEMVHQQLNYHQTTDHLHHVAVNNNHLQSSQQQQQQQHVLQQSDLKPEVERDQIAAAAAADTAAIPIQTAATTTTQLVRTVLNNHHRQFAHKLSIKFSKIKQVYNLHRYVDLLCETNKQQQQQLIKSTDTSNHQFNLNLIELEEILSEIDHYTLDWRKRSLDCLKLISESNNCTSIIITKLPLIVAFGHLICLGLGKYFSIDQIYSSNKSSSKEACLKRIKKKFGTTNRCSYIIVGNQEDVEMAKKLDLPAWLTSRTDGHRQLLQLYTALKEGYLM